MKYVMQRGQKDRQTLYYICKCHSDIYQDIWTDLETGQTDRHLPFYQVVCGFPTCGHTKCRKCTGCRTDQVQDRQTDLWLSCPY